MKPKTLEQWLDKNAPKWVQTAYREQTISMLEMIEQLGASKRADLEGRSGPIPKGAREDPGAREILRLWLTDENQSHTFAVDALDGPEEWGRCLGGLVRSLLKDLAKGACAHCDEEDCTVGVGNPFLHRFFEAAGIPISLVRVPSSSEDEEDEGGPTGLLN